MKRIEDDRTVILELSEHDASKLLALIRREINQADTIWRPYWERQASNVQKSIERINLLQHQGFQSGDLPNA